MRIHALLSADHKVGLGLGMRVGAPTLERWSAWLMRAATNRQRKAGAAVRDTADRQAAKRLANVTPGP